MQWNGEPTRSDPELQSGSTRMALRQFRDEAYCGLRFESRLRIEGVIGRAEQVAVRSRIVPRGFCLVVAIRAVARHDVNKITLAPPVQPGHDSEEDCFADEFESLHGVWSRTSTNGRRDDGSTVSPSDLALQRRPVDLD